MVFLSSCCLLCLWNFSVVGRAVCMYLLFARGYVSGKINCPPWQKGPSSFRQVNRELGLFHLLLYGSILHRQRATGISRTKHNAVVCAVALL